MCAEMIPNRESHIMLESSVGRNHLLLAKINCNSKVVAESVVHKTRLGRVET